jgi:sodium-dependent phosphate cotransporter
MSPLQSLQARASWIVGAQRAAAVLALLFVFLVGIHGMGTGFKMLGKDLLGAFFTATENPFVGLVVGILATTLMQSSSVTTSMIVGMVAAPENPLPLANAIPMVMGANIGTTVTNSIVSLAHMGRRDEFQRAFAVATCHDFFNYLTVAILLPAELAFGFLRRTAGVLCLTIQGASGVKYESPLKPALHAVLEPIQQLVAVLLEARQVQGVLLALVSASLIFFALFLLVKVMRKAMRTRVEVYLSRALGTNAVVSMIVGAVVTALVQSSSITTSLLVPLAGAGLITLRRAFPITLGANVGTTITALLAALAVSGPNAEAGVQIAVIHLLFNLSGILLVYPIERVRRLPLNAARRLAALAVKSRRWAVIYVLALFYVVPALLVLLDHLF